MAATIELLDGFLDVHEAQLRQMRFPAALHARLYEKLRGEVFDAGDAFTFQFDEAIAEQNSTGDQAPRCPLSLLAQRCIAAESDVWLVDHVWLFSTAASALAQLQDDEGLRARLAALFSIEDRPEAATAPRLYRGLMHVSLPIKLARDAAEAADGKPARSGQSLLHYVMDEVGSALRMAADEEEVNFGCHPFLSHSNGGRTFSLIWPLRDVEEGGAIVRARTAPPVQFLDLGEEYWEARFRSEASFEWLASFRGLRDALKRSGAWAEGATVLDAGCGNSSFAADLAGAADAADGPRLAMVHAVDISAAAIERQSRAFSGRSNLRWSVGDLTKLDRAAFPDASIDLVVDKGSLDSMLVKPSGEALEDDTGDTWLRSSPVAKAYLAEVARVLRRGGTFFLVSLGRRSNREPLLSATRDAKDQGVFAIESEEICVNAASSASSSSSVAPRTGSEDGDGDAGNSTRESPQDSWKDDYRIYTIRRL